MNISLTLKKYFHSQHELLDMRNRDERDINTLSTYLTQLHSIADKLRNNFDVNLSKYPEFRVLRVMRNYMHHVDDVEEVRAYVSLQPEVSLYHAEYVIVPISFWAKCLKNLIETNTRPEGHPQHASKKRFLDKELDGITDICDCFEVIEHLDAFCIVHEFSNNTELAGFLDEVGIDDTYSLSNNIPKYDLASRPVVNCILTTKGYIFPAKIEPAI